MQWPDIRKTYPNHWVLIEGFRPVTTPDNQRQFDDLAVVELCSNGGEAMKQYRKYKKLYPHREFYFIHTSHDKLEITVKKWLGIRRYDESAAD